MIVSLFQKFKNEAEHIGRILAGYTDLELALLQCANVLRNDFDTIFKAMYRARGETARIDIADAFGRHSFDTAGLQTEFGMGVGAMKHCMKICNQYAHCTWMDDGNGILGIVDFEELAKPNPFVKDLHNLTTRFISLILLRQQEEYFWHTDSFLLWLGREAQVRSGQIQRNPHPRPKSLAQPPLRNP